MSDYILLGLCLWCVASTYYAVVKTIQVEKLKLLLVGAVETIKDIHNGNAVVVETSEGFTIKRKETV